MSEFFHNANESLFANRTSMSHTIEVGLAIVAELSEPPLYKSALKSPHRLKWIKAMDEESQQQKAIRL